MSNEEKWALVVAIATVILFVIWVSKLLFWISLIGIIVGVVWLILAIRGEFEDTTIPIIVIGVCLIGAIIFYNVGYSFEKTPVGKDIVTTANTVVDVNNQIENVKQNITDTTLNALSDSIKKTN